MLRKSIVISIWLVMIGLLVVYHEPLLNWIQTSERDYIILTTLIATSMSLFPVIPYPLLGGIIGAVYGPILGGVMIWTGSTLASIIFFSMVRYGGFHQYGSKLLLKYPMTKKLTLLFEHNAFLSITTLRMVPLIPSIVINAYAALSRVPFIVYSFASGLGKIPAMTLFVLVGHTIVTDPREIFYMIGIYGIFLIVVYGFYNYWRKRVQAGLTVRKEEVTVD